MEEMIVIPKRELPTMIEKHRAGLMENHHLTQTASLAAKKERLLTDPTLTPEQKRFFVQPVSSALYRARKKIRRLNIPSSGESTDFEGDTEGEDDLTSSAFDKWMKRMVSIASKAEAGTPNVKKEKTSPSTKPKPPRPKKPAHLIKREIKSAPFSDSDLEKGYKGLKTPSYSSIKREHETLESLVKRKSREIDRRKVISEGRRERLQKTPLAVKRLKAAPGWEGWGEPVRRKLNGQDY